MDQTIPLRPREDEELFILIGQMLLRLQDAVVMAISHVHQRAVQGIAALSVLLLLLLVAAFLYGSFYFSYMPRAAYSTSVQYSYKTDCESPASILCSYPVANISLMTNNKHVMTVGQAYRISLQLEMPESRVNRDLGMFMIKTTCLSRDGGRVASSARSCMLRYRSDLLRTMGTLLLLPAFLTGVAEQKQKLQVELFSDYTHAADAPSVTAVIEVLSNKVQIYSSQLYVHAHFTGVRYLLFYHPFLSALLGVSSNFFFLAVLFILGSSRLQLLEQRRAEQVREEAVQLRTDGLACDQGKNKDGGQRETGEDAAAGSVQLLGPLQISPT